MTYEPEGSLGDQIKTQIALRCVVCLRVSQVELRPHIKRLGADYSFRRFCQRLRCRCGAKGSAWPTTIEPTGKETSPR